MCSPVPMKMMGACVAATAESAPPPWAWPSSFVRMTSAMSILALNAAACSCAAWPMVESSTKTTESGFTASFTSSISSKSAASWRCRPEVSTMMISNCSSLNFSTPANATAAGFGSV
eukprot:Amastigsp_a174505_1858.p6 type:complete len:117 gc:universal Amastigsp_a174505_1858:874-524(-)